CNCLWYHFNNCNNCNYCHSEGIIMKNHGVKPVLLSRRQIEALQRIQDEERQKSVLGVAPSIHVIARQLMDKALKEVRL
ncbi:hypothetical protein, partial [Escherichia coli]